MTDTDFFRDVVAGLSSERKSLPAKYFYDERGSDLFNRICELEEYYVTRTEEKILGSMAGELAERMKSRCAIFEFGPGSPRKISSLLARFDNPAAYIPVEISQSALTATVTDIRARFPSLPIFPIRADFTAADLLTYAAPDFEHARLGLLLGSTLGNFDPESGTRLLRSLALWLGKGAFLLIGTDLKKDPRVLEAAYNDRAGVTAEFNLNLLARINRELGGDFGLERFEHRAFFNAAQSRIEMHLVSKGRQEARIDGAPPFRFHAGETIHTENSYKHTLESFSALAQAAGLARLASWKDPNGFYCLHLLVAFPKRPC